MHLQSLQKFHPSQTHVGDREALPRGNFLLLTFHILIIILLIIVVAIAAAVVCMQFLVNAYS